MATATEICERALRRARVYDATQSAPAIDVSNATEALNAMIASWEAEGLSGDVLPLDARYEQAVVAMLAVRICEEYGKTPGPVLMRDADNGWLSLQAAYLAVPNSSFETSLKWTGPNATYQGGVIVGEPVNYAAWTESTAYDERTFVTNGFNLYECVTGGTSAASGGPTGTDASITDGTCVWCWRKVIA